MAIILDFPSPKHQDPLSSSETQRKLAEIVIFPGVRYDRSKETSSSPPDGTLGSNPKSRRTKKK